MTFENYMLKPGEQPLDNVPADGGFASIFRTIAVIGDSLSSGEFEAIDHNGGRVYVDMFDYSWGQYMARKLGSKVYNFSRGGMTAIEYWNSFGESIDAWNPEKKCQAYIVALAVNDLFGMNQEVGNVATDVHDDDPDANADTFVGYYCKVLQRVKKISPDAKFFLMTMPKSSPEANQDEKKALAAKAIYDIAEHYDNTYVIDLFKYAPDYDAKFHECFFMNGHLNAMGYKLTADIVCAYIDYIVRSNPKDFNLVGFINTEYMPMIDREKI